MKTKTLVPFLVLSFGLTWGIAALLILFYDQVVAIFGEISLTNPLFILAVYSPGFAGAFLVWRHYGIKGMGQFLSTPDFMACPRSMVAVPHLGHSPARLRRRHSEGIH